MRQRGRARDRARWAVVAAWAALLLTSAAPPGTGAAPVPPTPDTAAVERMSVPQAMLAAKRGEVVLVDVRLDGQRALGHVTGDVHIPLTQLAARTGELPAGKKWLF